MTRLERMAIGGAALIAVATPAAVLGLARDPAPTAVSDPPLLAIRAPAPTRAIYTRDLFGAGIDDATPPADAPEVAGIVGRIGADAVAMVRAADGRTRTIAVGEAVDGWTLESLAIDAAYFTRGGQQARVPLPAGE